jgi:hypothetical protein
MLNSCKNKSEEHKIAIDEVEEITFVSFGNDIIADDAIASSSMAFHYKSMNVGDSINSKMSAKVNEVCQAKGCWMTLNLEDGHEVMVKFKDYGFFVPKDIAGKEVIVNGKAFVNEVSVNEQRHYAEDAGKTQEEIAQITEPKRTFSFEADGVLVKQ